MKYSKLSLEQKQKLAFTLLTDEDNQQIFKNLSPKFKFPGEDEKIKGLDDEDDTYTSPYDFINNSQKESFLVKYKSLTFFIPKHIIETHFNYGCILCAILMNHDASSHGKLCDVSNMFDDLSIKISDHDFQTYINFLINSDMLHSFSQFKDKDIQSYDKFKIFHNDFLNHMFMGGDYKYSQFLGKHDNMLYNSLNDLRSQIADYYKRIRPFPELKNLCNLVYNESKTNFENNNIMLDYMENPFMEEHRHYIAIQKYRLIMNGVNSYRSRLLLDYSRDIRDYDGDNILDKLDSIFDYYSITETKTSPIYILKHILHNIINWNQWIIAGGFVTTLVLSGFTDMTYNLNDIDLFLLNDDKEINSADILKMTLSKIDQYLNFVSSGRFNRSYLVRSKHAVTYFVHIPDSKKQLKYVQLQFILRQYKQKEQVLLGFDIDSSCFACNFDKNKKLQIYATQRGLRSLYRGNVIDPSRQSSSYLQRLMKYYEKYSIPIVIPGLCLDTLQSSVDLNYLEPYRTGIPLDYIESRNQNRYFVTKDIKTFELENNKKKICKQLYTLFRRTSNGIIGLLKLCFCTDTSAKLSLNIHKNKNKFIPPFIQQKNKNMLHPEDNNDEPQKWYTYLDESTNTFIQLYLYYEAKMKLGSFRQFLINVEYEEDPDEFNSFDIESNISFLPYIFHGRNRRYRTTPAMNDFYFYKHFLISRNVKDIIDGYNKNIIISKCYELKENENIPSFQTKKIQFMSKNPGNQFTGSFNPTHSKIYNIHPMYYITHEDCKTKRDIKREGKEKQKIKFHYC